MDSDSLLVGSEQTCFCDDNPRMWVKTGWVQYPFHNDTHCKRCFARLSKESGLATRWSIRKPISLMWGGYRIYNDAIIPGGGVAYALEGQPWRLKIRCLKAEEGNQGFCRVG